MEFRKDSYVLCDGRNETREYTLEFNSGSDRDTAAKMIEAMEWLAKHEGSIHHHLECKPNRWYCVLFDGLREIGEAERPTPWDAILAAKEASGG